jgi:hypothetical protein
MAMEGAKEWEFRFLFAYRGIYTFSPSDCQAAGILQVISLEIKPTIE